MKDKRRKQTPLKTAAAECLPPRPILLKYCGTALVPFELLAGDSLRQTYILASGETVSLTYLSCINNRDMSQQKRLEEESEHLHRMPFESVQKAWEGRTGRISDIWYKVKMNILCN